MVAAVENQHVVEFIESTTPWAVAYLWTGDAAYLKASVGWRDLLEQIAMQPHDVRQRSGGDLLRPVPGNRSGGRPGAGRNHLPDLYDLRDRPRGKPLAWVPRAGCLWLFGEPYRAFE